MNINTLVKVRLTEYGVDVMEKKNPVAMAFHFDKNTKTLKTELWDLMNIFGEQMYMGAKQVFENNNIEIMPE